MSPYSEPTGSAAADTQNGGANRVSPWTVVGVLVITVLLGALTLPAPFEVDQTIFLFGALELHDGGKLYRDFWDINQPGIFLWYRVAGSLFGFDEVGIHLAELIWMSLLALVLVWTLRGWHDDPGFLYLDPLLTVGLYFAISFPWIQTQKEAVVGLPLYMAVWLSTPINAFEPRVSLKYFLSGVLGAAICLFKLLFLPVLLAVWAVSFAEAILGRRERLTVVIRRALLPLGVGLLLGLLGVVLYTHRAGYLQELIHTTFVVPAQILREIELDHSKYLNFSLPWFAKFWAPLLALAVVGTASTMRGNRWRRLLALQLVAWTLTAFLLFMIQPRSWYAYHLLLLVVPIGILAARGIEVIWGLVVRGFHGPTRTKRVVFLLALFCLFLPVWLPVMKKVRYAVTSGYSLSDEGSRRYQLKTSGEYTAPLQDAGFYLKVRQEGDTLFVMGDPRILFLANERYPISFHGLSLETMTADRWRQLESMLDEAEPDFIYVTTLYKSYLLSESPTLVSMLEERYQRIQSSIRGFWYERLY